MLQTINFDRSSDGNSEEEGELHSQRDIDLQALQNDATSNNDSFNFIGSKAEKHFEKYAAECSCNIKCVERVNNLKDLCSSFNTIGETQKRNIIRSMPLALSSDKGEQNDLNRYINKNRKQKRRKCTNE